MFSSKARGKRRHETPRCPRGGFALVAVLPLAVVCAAVIAYAPASAGAAAKTSQPQPKPLWKAFPLTRSEQPARPERPNAGQEHSRASGEAQGSGDGVPGMWIAVAAAVLVVAASAVALRSLRIVPSVAGRLWLPANPARGGVSMANFRRRMQSHGETDVSGQQSQDEARSGEGISDVAAQRLLAYSVTSPEPTAGEGAREAPAGPADEDAKPAEAEAQVDLTAVGEEVGAVLTSAQEAAAAIRRTAELKAERVRAEAKAAAAAEVQEAKRSAEADRAEGARMRAEAERQAAQAVDEANRRLQAADAEAERRIAQADEKARERVTTLRTESAQHEERIRSMVAVFRGVTAQLEDLLAGKRAEESDETASGERLEDALRPDAFRSTATLEETDAPR